MSPFLFFLVRFQVVCRKSGPRPRQLVTKKNDHIGHMVAMSAAGWLSSDLWTFPGVRMTRSRVEGTKFAKFNLTRNGWPDESSFLLLLKELVAYMTERGLQKLLLIVDNCPMHQSIYLRDFARQHNITMLGLPPNATHVLQPLDVAYFGMLKNKVRALANAASERLSEHNIAKYVEKAREELVAKAAAEGTTVAAAGFRKTGIWPFNRDAIRESDYKGSDEHFELSNASEAVQKARADLTPEQAKEFVDNALKPLEPETLEKMGKAAQKQVEAKKIDPNRAVYTHETAIKCLLEQDEMKEKEAEAVAGRKRVREEKAAAKEAKEEEQKRAKAEAPVMAPVKAKKAKIVKKKVPAAKKKTKCIKKKKTAARKAIKTDPEELDMPTTVTKSGRKATVGYLTT